MRLTDEGGTAMLATGTVLQNRYRIVSLLGQGGMGAVYRAWHLSLNTPVAVKEMVPQPGLDTQALTQLRQQFRQEAAALSTLDHTHLVTVLDFFEEGGNAYLVMRLVEGESLAERIVREGALPEAQVLAWADQLLDALAYCHGRGIIHRDIKPQNVIVRSDGRAVLVDFGLVKLWDPDAPQTRTALRGMGTPEYAPPEQYGIRPGHTDPRSDLYSLGATLYHALTGEAPMTANDRMADPDHFAPLRALNPRISVGTEEAVLRAMELSRKRRFQSAAKMQTALSGGATASPRLTPAKPQPTPERRPTRVMPGARPAAQARRRVPGWVWAIGGAAVLTVFAILIIWSKPLVPTPTPLPVSISTKPLPVSTPTKLPATSTAAYTPTTLLAGKLEIFSWWTAGGEAEGLEAMLEAFSAKFPDVEVINAAVATGADVDTKAVLVARMQSGDPPDLFQVHAGHELIDTWVKADKMEPVTFIFERNGWLDRYPPGVVEILSHGGEIWSVPVSVHRSNVMWYNKEALASCSVAPPTTFDEFFDAAEELQAAGITPLALGDNGIWASTQLFETVLLGVVGPEEYRGLWDGTTDWGGPEIKEALEIFARMLEYANDDHAALSWDQAARRVADGDAAMTIMGDWTHGYYTSIGLKAGVDYGWAPSPGTAGSFIMLSDSFGLPKGAPHRENAIAWLTVCGSKEGQDAFNPLRGSIPARLDGDRSLYDGYFQSVMDDFATDEIVPSLTHGAAASEGWVSAIHDVMARFVADLDVEAAQEGLIQACVDTGVCR